MRPFTIDVPFGYDDLEGTAEINVTSLGCPAYINGPPEHCYPAEPPEWEILGITFSDANVGDAKYWMKNVSERLELDDHFAEEVIRIAREEAQREAYDG